MSSLTNYNARNAYHKKCLARTPILYPGSLLLPPVLAADKNPGTCLASNQLGGGSKDTGYQVGQRPLIVEIDTVCTFSALLFNSLLLPSLNCCMSGHSLNISSGMSGNELCRRWSKTFRDFWNETRISWTSRLAKNQHTVMVSHLECTCATIEGPVFDGSASHH